jgi:hypothetical protein
MNRRKFFGMTIGAIAAAGLSPLLLPEKTIFLPPRYGWKPSALGHGYMREVKQYSINQDELLYRYDAVGRDIWGQEYQFHADTSGPGEDLAKHLFADKFAHEGLIAVPIGQSRQLQILLPNNCVTGGRYI